MELIKVAKRSQETLKAQHQQRLSTAILMMRMKMSILSQVLDLAIT
jgi:hypothetical protein